MRSRTGGMGRAGGEGEVHSPSSMKVSATMPSKGALRTVWSSWAWARATAETARSAAARAARQAASAPRASLSTRSRISGETRPSFESLCVRSRSRPARSAARQAWSRWASEALLSSPERRSWACCRASSTRRRISPLRTRVPRRWGSRRTRPPVSGASLARRRAFTVPAREFVTVSSTRPFSAATVRTGTGAGAKTVSRRRTPTATRRARSGEAGPEVTDSHDRQPPAIVSQRPWQPRGVVGGSESPVIPRDSDLPGPEGSASAGAETADPSARRPTTGAPRDDSRPGLHRGVARTERRRIGQI